LGTSKPVSAANNGGRFDPTITTPVEATWISDRKFIMWKEGDAFTPDATDFSGIS